MDSTIYKDSVIKEAYKLFISKGMLRREVMRDEISLSWARCKVYRLDSENIKEIPVHPTEYHSARNNDQALIQSTTPAIENFISINELDHLNLSLCNLRGLVLIDWIADSGLLAFRQGLYAIEEHYGTNGAALSISSQSRFIVYGAEHYISSLQLYVTFGIPIGSKDTSIFGYLAGMIPYPEFQESTILKLEHLATLIAGSIQKQKSMQATAQLKENYAFTLDSVPEIIINFDKFGQITYANKRAMLAFSHKMIEVTQFNIRELLFTEDPMSFEKILSTHKEFLSFTGFIDTTNGVRGATVKLTSNIEKGEAENYSAIITPIDAVIGDWNKLILTPIESGLERLVGKSTYTGELRKKIRMIAESEGHCYFFGEPGTGKKTIARMIHETSSRKNERFVYFNCENAAMGSFEREFFGCVVNDEDERIIVGAVECANRGTVYLDNINKLSISNQLKLLRMIDEKKHKRCGSKFEINLDVRIFTSSTKPLEILVSKGVFRSELFNRISFNRIDTIPLRSRKEDILPIAKFLIGDHFKNHQSPQLSEEFTRKLENYFYPENLQELERIINLVVFRNKNSDILSEGCLDFLDGSEMLNLEPNTVKTLDEIEKQAIQGALTMTRWNLSLAAKQLGIGRSTLYRKMERYNIEMSQNDTQSCDKR